MGIVSLDQPLGDQKSGTIYLWLPALVEKIDIHLVK